jgi:hypothetical protein
MASMAEHQKCYKIKDALALEQAARAIRRRVKKPAGISTSAFCRVLLAEASALRAEARKL